MSHVNPSSSQRLHWQGLWKYFDRHGEVLDVFVPTKRTVDGARFGLVRMGSRDDALRVIEGLDGFVLYGSRVKVSFAWRIHEIHFGDGKRGGHNFTGKGAIGGQSRRAEGVIDEEKLSVLETCALGGMVSVGKVRIPMCLLYISGLSIHLWSEGSFRNITGLWGKYLWVDAPTEEPISFERARILIVTSMRGRIDEVVEVVSLGTIFPIVVQEAELVRVLTVEQRGVVDGAALIEQSQEVSVASPWKKSTVEQFGDDSPHWHANQIWEIESARKGRGASMVVGGASNRRGVCSDGEADFAFTGIQSEEGLDIVRPSVSIAERV
ncbi:hypothetical protein GQ457_02G022160 [Hibiscus cannabinus]